MLRDPLPRGPDDAAAASPEVFEFQLYRYTPSLPAAVVAVVVFAILTAVHVWRIHKAGSVYFIPFTVGGLCTYSRSSASCVLVISCPLFGNRAYQPVTFLSQSRYSGTPVGYGLTMTP